MSFVKKATLIGGSQLALALAGMLSSVIYSRFLGPDGVGQYSVFMSTMTITVPLTTFGIGRANIFFINSGRFSRRDVISQSTFVGLIVGGAVTLGMTLVFHWSSDFYGVVPLHILFAFSFGMACQVVISLLRPVLIATLAGRRLVSIDATQRLTIIVAALSIVLTGTLTVGKAMCVTALAALLTMLLLFYFLRNDLSLRYPLIRMSWLRETSFYGMKIAASSILFTLTSSATVLIIRHQLPDDFASVGFYTRAVTISTFAVLLPRTVSPLFYAKWADARNTDRVPQVERAARFNVFYGAMSALVLVLFGKLAVLVLYGAEFMPAYGVLLVFAPAMVFVCLFSIFNSLLASDGRAAAAIKVLAITLIVVCTMTYVTVPIWGVYGAAAAVLVGNMLSTGLTAIVCRRVYALHLSRMLLIRPDDFSYLYRALTRRG